MAEAGTPQRALDEAIIKIGSQSALARLLRISQPAVSGWVRKGLVLPAEHVLKVEASTGVSRFDLRPDLYRREIVVAEPISDPEVAR